MFSVPNMKYEICKRLIGVNPNYDNIYMYSYNELIIFTFNSQLQSTVNDKHIDLSTENKYAIMWD